MPSAFPAGFYTISNNEKAITCPSGLPGQPLRVDSPLGSGATVAQQHWLVVGAGIFTSQKEGFIAIGNSSGSDDTVKSFKPDDSSTATVKLSTLFVVVDVSLTATGTLTGKIVTNDKNKKYWGLAAGDSLVHLKDIKDAAIWTFNPITV